MLPDAAISPRPFTISKSQVTEDAPIREMANSTS